MRILAPDVLRRSAGKLGIRKRRFATLTRTARLLVTASLLQPVSGAGCGTSDNENSGDGGALADANLLPDREDATSQACVPTTCSGRGISCGPAGNGCGGALQCGECTAPETCGGGGHSSVCGTGGGPCVPKTCGGVGYDCGPAGDGCGGSLSCGDCTAPQTCGGGGNSSVCGSPASDGDASPGDASTSDTSTPPTDSDSGGTFDYYISTTGSDGSPGALAAPWAITSLMNRSINANNKANYAKTSGKRIGFLPGAYNVSGQMQPDSYSGAIQIDGGTPANPTYYGSSGSNGHYSIGTATISALTAGAAHGGGSTGLITDPSWPILKARCTLPATS
jgi:hypothetical protein